MMTGLLVGWAVGSIGTALVIGLLSGNKDK